MTIYTDRLTGDVSGSAPETLADRLAALEAGQVSLDSALTNNLSAIQKGQATLERFGGVAGDETFDNTAALTAAIASGVPISLTGMYWFASDMPKTSGVPVTIAGMGPQTGFTFRNATTVGNAAFEIEMLDPNDFVSLRNFGIYSDAISGGTGIFLDASLQAFERVGKWGEIIGLTVGGTNTIAGRWESENGFDEAGIRVDQANNFVLRDNLVFGRQDVSQSAQARFCIAEAAFKFTCPTNNLSSPFLHGTGVQLSGNRAFWAKKGFEVDGDFEGYVSSKDEAIGCDYGHYIVAAALDGPRVHVEIDGGHSNVFIENIHIENVQQWGVVNHLFYKRPDATSATTAVRCVNANRSTGLSGNIFVNNTVDETTGGAWNIFDIEDCADIQISNNNASRFTTFIKARDGAGATNRVRANDNHVIAPLSANSTLLDDTTASQDVVLCRSSPWGGRSQDATNSAAITVAGTVTTLLAANIDAYAPLLDGQRFRVFARAKITGPAAAGVTTLKLVKAAGDAVGVFSNTGATAEVSESRDAGETATPQIFDILTITDAGAGQNYSLQLQATTTGGGGECAINDAVLILEAI